MYVVQCDLWKGLLTASLVFTSLLGSSHSAQACSWNPFDRLYFDAGSAAITDEYAKPLRSFAEWMKGNREATVTVEGHADARGSSARSDTLSQQRAQTVVDFLVAEGVEKRRLKSVSFGTTRPVAVCDEEACYSQNRRAVFVIEGVEIKNPCAE
jgi:peptidoglycan-associated lipoprotein